jgi:hypothetical protein
MERGLSSPPPAAKSQVRAYRLALAASMAFTVLLAQSPARPLEGSLGQMETSAFTFCLISALLCMPRPFRALVWMLGASTVLLACLEAFDLWLVYLCVPAALPAVVAAEGWQGYRMWLPIDCAGVAGQLVSFCAVVLALRRVPAASGPRASA